MIWISPTTPPSELHGDKVEQEDVKMKLTEETIQTTQEVLFDFIAKALADFVKKRNITNKLPLGFTFSFPVEQTSLTVGTLRRWTKDYTASGAVGRDVIDMLKEAFARTGGVRRDKFRTLCCQNH